MGVLIFLILYFIWLCGYFHLVFIVAPRFCRSTVTNTSVGLQFRRWPRYKWLKCPSSSVAKLFSSRRAFWRENLLFQISDSTHWLVLSHDLICLSFPQGERILVKELSWISRLFHQHDSFKTFFENNWKHFGQTPALSALLMPLSQRLAMLLWYSYLLATVVTF